MLRKVIQAVPSRDYLVELTYSDGDSVMVDFKPLIERGGVFAALADTEFFEQVSVADDGRYIGWPGELEFCADALWLQQHAEDSPAA